MTAEAGGKKPPGKPGAAAAERERRLAEALRANLRRRKGQARDRQKEPAEVPAAGPPRDSSSSD